jgi:hypothetical protein
MERTPFEDSGAEEVPAPPTEAQGELVPPPRKPPTAIGVSGPLPRPPHPDDDPEMPPRGLRLFLERVFDVLDAAGDTLATRLGLRR